MTKKDYIIIAQAINRVLLDCEAIAKSESKKITAIRKDTITSVINELSYRLAQQNPLFNSAKFENACLTNK